MKTGLLRSKDEPDGNLMLTYWMDENFQLFVRRDGKEWDEEYIHDVLTTPPEKTQEMTGKLTGSVVLAWYLNNLEGGNEYLIFTLDEGETWEDKEDDIRETIRKEWGL